jgi:hypothetical protein
LKGKLYFEGLAGVRIEMEFENAEDCEHLLRLLERLLEASLGARGGGGAG